jgi:hypothetical protein
VDTVIRGNLIRGVYHQKQGAFGIWIDYANQSVRITGNIIYRTQTAPLFIEMNHGPMLVDNNILVGHEVLSNSEATVFAHNLFVDCGYHFRPDRKRKSAYYAPHTTKPAGRGGGDVAREDLWFNNLFVRTGMDGVRKGDGYRSDFNVFLEGAKPSAFGDAKSVVAPAPARFAITDHPLGATVTFAVDDRAAALEGPWVDAKLAGVFTTVGQTLEDRHGKPIRVTRDLTGNAFRHPVPGPLAALKAGPNAVTWTYKKHK